MKWRNWLSALIGVWFVIAPWVLGVSHHTSVMWSSVWIGAVQFVVSAWAAATVRVVSWKTWQNWIAVVTGFAFIIIPFLGDYEEAPYWATAGAGIVTMVLNLWTLMANPDTAGTGTDPRARA